LRPSAEARNGVAEEFVLMDQEKGDMGDPKKFLSVSYDGCIEDIAWILTNEGHQVKHFIESMDNRDIADGFVEKSEEWQGDVERPDVIVFDDALGQGHEAIARC
jgi:phosphoribosylamine--glycine ligase